MSSGKEKGKIMGSVHVEDIEADVTTDGPDSAKKEISDLEQNKENIGIGKGVEITNKPEQMVAFNMLVEKMKSSGTLPEKPQPVVSLLVFQSLSRCESCLLQYLFHCRFDVNSFLF